MANHQSAVKRTRQSEQKKEHNKYYAKSTRNAIKELKNTSKKGDAQKMLPKVAALIDKLSKKHIVHKNKAANLKSQLSKHVNSL
jgi:small subunit ribosomal protein S20